MQVSLLGKAFGTGPCMGPPQRTHRWWKGGRMRYGLNLRPAERVPTVEGYVQMAELAERLQFDTLWHFDHVVLPEGFHKSPYRQLYGREPNMTAEEPFFEPLTTLAFVAAKVHTPRLGLAVLV